MTHKGGDSQALLVDTQSSTKLLAPDFPVEKNTSAELEISANGFFLYASNRGEDTLVVFSIDQTSGDLKEIQRIKCGGKAPRHFTIAPTGNWLLCGNQDSGSGDGVQAGRRDGKADWSDTNRCARFADVHAVRLRVRRSLRPLLPPRPG